MKRVILAIYIAFMVMRIGATVKGTDKNSPKVNSALAFAEEATDNVINIIVDDYKQEFVGAGGSTGNYAHTYTGLPDDYQDKAARLLAEAIPMKYLKTYLSDYPDDGGSKFVNVAKIYKQLKQYSPDLEFVICVSSLPEGVTRLEHDKCAEYYFSIMQWYHNEGITVSKIDLVNEEGAQDEVIGLFSGAVDELRNIINDPVKNPDGLAMPLIMGPSCWSAKSVSKFVDLFKQKDGGKAWDNIDILATHGYENGSYEYYKEGNDLKEHRLFMNSEQTGKIQTKESDIDPLALQWVAGTEPEYIGDVSIAMRMTDFINAGGNAFYIFQLQNTSGNNAALIRTSGGSTNPVVEPSKVYYGFKHLTAIQPKNSHRVERDLTGLDNFKVLTVRKKDDDNIYVHITNLWPNTERVNISLSDLGASNVGIKSVEGWVTDQYRDESAFINNTYSESLKTFSFNATPHSVTTLKIEIDPNGYTNDAFLQEQVITFDPVGDLIEGGADVQLAATTTSGLPLTYTVLSGNATIEGNSMQLNGSGLISIKATQAGNGTYMPADYIYTDICVKAAKPSVVLEDGVLVSSSLESNTWYIDGEKLEGSASQRITPLKTGNYTVVVGEGDCSTSSDAFYYEYVGNGPAVYLHFEDEEIPAGVSYANGACFQNLETGEYEDEIATVTTDVDTKKGSRSLQMGNSGYIKFDSGILNPKAYSISFWVKWKDIGKDVRDAVLAGSTLISARSIGAEGSYEVSKVVGSKTTNSLKLFNNGNQDAGFELDGERQWTHITLTSAYASDEEDGESNLYANGVLIRTRPVAGSFKGLENAEILIGADFDELDLPVVKEEVLKGFVGYFDDVKLFNYVLSEEDIVSNYEADMLKLSIQGSAESILVGNTVSIKAELLSGLEVGELEWAVVSKDGNGAASINNIGELTAIQAGVVTVIAKSKGGVGYTGIFDVTINVSTSVNNNSGSDYGIYPNPVKNHFYLQTSHTVSLEIFNMLGQKVITKQEVNKGQVDVSNLTSGRYLVKIIGDKIETISIVVL